MSRYGGILANSRLAIWGYDAPLDEYFIHVHKLPGEMIDEDDELLYAIANKNTFITTPEQPDKELYTNEEIGEILKSFGDVVPVQHIEAITEGKPF